jgi:hypothetical protein
MILYTENIERLKIVLASKPTANDAKLQAERLTHIIYACPCITYALNVDETGIFWRITAWINANCNSFAFELSYDPIKCHWELTERCKLTFAQMGIEL